VFEGPLFIVGLSRSGTTLLRSLLNQNSRISMTPAESHFIPYLLKKYGKDPDFSTEGDRERLKCDLKRTLFVKRMQLKGHFMDWDALKERMKTNNWNEIIKYVFQTFAKKKYQSGMIWGDKTPRYLPYVPEIKEVLHDARFIHIVRDPRDRAMSVKARWGKLFSRSASEWNQQLTLSRTYPGLLGKDYKEILYEDLLTDPERTLTDICKFVEVGFEPEMLTLEKAERRHGDTRGKLHVVAENFNKFVDRLPEKGIRRIEEITFPMMREMGYSVTVATGYVPVGRVRGFFIRILDIVLHVWSILKEFGFRAGVRRSLHVFRTRVLLKNSSK
jgi:hypothetical protein